MDSENSEFSNEPTSSYGGTESTIVEDVLELTSAEVYKQLEKAWLNEKFSPELLCHRSDLIDCISEELNRIEEEIKRSEKNTLDSCMKKMDVERIRYMLANYLRLRVEKIEQFIFDVIEEDQKRKANRSEVKMSVDETRYAVQYRKSLMDNFQDTALTHMPPNLKNIQLKQIATVPILDQYVFVRTEKDVKDVSIQDPVDEMREELLDLEPGSQHLLPYKAIAVHMRQGDVNLI